MEFKTLSEAQAAYSELEVTSQALLDESAEKVQTLEAGSVESQAAMAEAVSKLKALESEKAELVSLNASLEAQNKELEDHKVEVQAEAARLAANSGIEPVEVTTEGNDENEISRSEFDAMSQKERHAFIKDGGTITI